MAVAKGGSTVRKKKEKYEQFTAKEVFFHFFFSSPLVVFFGDVPIAAELGHYGRIDSV